MGGDRQFVLSAFDRDQWCPVLQARFAVDDVGWLRATLGSEPTNDPEFRQNYVLAQDELAAVVDRFAVAFDPSRLRCRAIDIFLFRSRSIDRAPYLIHTGYELPLLIDGRKKLACFADSYPPMRHDGEDRFDRWVAAGLLHKEECIEPFDPPLKKWSGVRTVYYTPKGEEWRVQARKLICGKIGKIGAWNEILEKLEGVLFGYEDWQNDWWIEHVTARGGSFGGVSLCCAINAAEMQWLESAGWRALPPIERPTVEISRFDAEREPQMLAFMDENPSSVALVRFNVLGRYLDPFVDLRHAGPWTMRSERIPEINRLLRGSVVVAIRRESS